MGMYTELLIKADIVRNPPVEVVAVLNFLFNSGEEPKTLPDHPFFKKERWSSIGRCSSFYHIPWVSSKYEEGYLFSRSDLKNYDGEIDAFLDWLFPYIDEEDGKCIGWKFYEESDDPTLINFVAKRSV